MPYKKYAPKRKTTPRKKYVKRTAPKSTKTFRTKVKAVVKRMQEVKQFTQALVVNSPILTFHAGTAPPTYYDLIGSYMNTLPSGSNDGERVGDRISTRSFVIRGYLNCPTASDPDTNYPNVVRMVIFKDKTNVDFSTNLCTDFFEGTTPALSTPSNNLQDIMRHINNERYTVLAQRVFKIGPAASGYTGMNANNDFKISKFFRINLTKDLKQFVFNTTSGHVTNHPSLYVVFFAVPGDGTTAGAGYTAPVNYTLYADYKYTDS